MDFVHLTNKLFEKKNTSLWRVYPTPPRPRLYCIYLLLFLQNNKLYFHLTIISILFQHFRLISRKLKVNQSLKLPFQCRLNSVYESFPSQLRCESWRSLHRWQNKKDVSHHRTQRVDPRAKRIWQITNGYLGGAFGKSPTGKRRTKAREFRRSNRLMCCIVYIVI